MYKVLMIEDDEAMARIFRDILKPEGFETLHAPTGEEGLRAAAQERPDLILLDVNLPDANGVDICRTLKLDAATRHIPVLMLTGEAREVVQRVAGLDSGAEDYLFKPIGAKVLVARVKAILKLATRPT